MESIECGRHGQSNSQVFPATPPSADPLPLGVRRYAWVVIFKLKSGGAGPGRGTSASAGAGLGWKRSWRRTAVSLVRGARPGLARSNRAREYSSDAALRRTASAK